MLDPAFANRPHFLPGYSLVENHPQLPGFECWVALVDPYEQKQYEEDGKFAGLRIPHSVIDRELRAMGHLELRPGVAILARNVHGSQDPNDDVIKAFVTHEGEIRRNFSEHVENIEKVREKMLGPREGRQGNRRGGNPFEASRFRSHSTAQGKRCFATATSTEHSKGIFHGALNTAMRGGATLENDPDLLMRKELNHVRLLTVSFLYAHLLRL